MTGRSLRAALRTAAIALLLLALPSCTWILNETFIWDKAPPQPEPVSGVDAGW